MRDWDLKLKQIPNTINKRKLIPWIDWDLIPVIANNDGDGIASTLFLLNHPLTKERTVMKGIYTLDKLYLVNKADKYHIKDMVGIDLEMQIKGMHCIGHHMNINYNPNSLNFNDLFGVSENILSNFQNKCPLNTLILLYWLFDEKPKNDKEIAFLVYWDSVIWNHQQYHDNVVQWLKTLKMDEILDALENRRESLMNIIENEILPITNAFETGYEKSKLPQCNITPYYNHKRKVFYYPLDNSSKSLSKILNLMNKIMGWKTSGFKTKFYFRDNYIYTTFTVEEEFLHFKKQLENIQDKFISSAITSKQNFRVTTKEPIEKEAEQYGLIISNNGVYQRKKSF